MSDSAAFLRPGEIEFESGLPIPGKILPPERWVKTAIKRLPETGPLDWNQIFQRTAPIVLDLGCGNGRFVISSAVRRPDVDHFGIDILPMVIRYATRRGNQRGLSNTRFAVAGACEFLTNYAPLNSIDEIHIYHPQPFHDQVKSHQRLMTPEFLVRVHQALKPTGQLYLQTDNAPYWAYMKSVIPAFFQFCERMEAWEEDPAGRTRREILARAQGLPIFRAICWPRSGIGSDELRQMTERLPQPKFQSHKPHNKGRRGRFKRR